MNNLNEYNEEEMAKKQKTYLINVLLSDVCTYF